MPVYNLSAMADRVAYLQSQGQDEQQAKQNVYKEYGIRGEIPQQVEEQLSKRMANPTQDSRFARNDKEYIVDRSQPMNSNYDLGEQRQDLTPSEEAPTEEGYTEI